MGAVHPGSLVALTVRKTGDVVTSFADRILIDTRSRLPANLADGGAEDKRQTQPTGPVLSSAAAVVPLATADTQLVTLTPCRSSLDEEGAGYNCTIVDMDAGDVDGDGYADLVAITRSADTTGAVYGSLFLWRGPFVPSSLPRFFASPAVTAEVNDIINASTGVLVVDGLSGGLGGSIVVSSSVLSLDANRFGGLVILRNTTYGHADSVAHVLHPHNPDTADFAASVASCDFDGDGVEDVLVGVPEWSKARGSVYLYLGKSDGSVDRNAIVIHSPLYADGFGSQIVCGDVDEDGRGDLAVRSTFGTFRAVNVYAANTNQSTDSKLPAYSAWSTAGNHTGISTEGLAFIDGVGLIVGEPDANNNAGRPVLYSAPHGNWTNVSETFFLSHAAGSRTGATVVGARAVLDTPGFVAASAPLLGDYSLSETHPPGGVFVFDIGRTGGAQLTPVASSSTVDHTSTTTRGGGTTSTAQRTDGTSQPFLETVDGTTDSGLDVRVTASLAAAAIILLLALVVGGLAWLRRKRRVVAAAGATAGPAQGQSRRQTRGTSAARFNRTPSRSAVRPRRSRTPTLSQDKPPIIAFGETSLAVPPSTTQYAQTSLYPQPAQPS